ncbi:ft-interacting protein 1 [Quercus suber]|uniref:Ft-interacting protein 1 n=1 Tax=Quercus suber TaxID=58331 RepID=A0AAW0JKD8_QUESU
MQKPQQPVEFALKETTPKIGAGAVTGDKLSCTYDLVEQMQYLYVRVVKAKDLPGKDITGSCDPYVEVKLGNYKGVTKHFEKKSNPEWNQVFAFSKERIQASVLEVVLKDHDVVLDDFMGRIMFELNDIPKRVPPDSPLAPQWYRLEDRKGDKVKGELMLAVWMGTQADEAFPDAWHSDAATVGPMANSKAIVEVQHWDFGAGVISAQGLMPMKTKDGRGTTDAFCVAKYGQKWVRTRTIVDSFIPKWNEQYIWEVFDPCTVLTIVLYPELILPTIFLYLFLIGIWNYRWRARHPPHMDTRLSHADVVHPDELDEEFDTFPTSKPADTVRMRYDRLRSIAGRVQTGGDMATQGERFNLCSAGEIQERPLYSLPFVSLLPLFSMLLHSKLLPFS